MKKNNSIGVEIYSLLKELFPICRSITGDGVRKTLEILSREISDLKIVEVPSGTICFDWTIPKEWNINDAYIVCPDGKKIAKFNRSNLHVLGYSEPINRKIDLAELNEHLFSIPEQPNAIPYRTSYYSRRWGFCIEHSLREKLKPGEYQVYIDSELKNGSLTYGEIIIPGITDKEILISTYICHPSMANNELSGPCVATYITKWLLKLKNRKYTYRIIFIPETIGSICYLSQHLIEMKKKVEAGFNLTCLGDDNSYSYIESRQRKTLADRVANHVISHICPGKNKKYSFLKAGGDELQYCSPGVDLPLVSLMRTKYREYPEYHTSLDNLDFVSPSGLEGGFDFVKLCLICLENNQKLELSNPCQPQLGKRDLYPTLSTGKLNSYQRSLVDLISYADGRDLLSIADTIGVKMWELFDYVERLENEKLLLRVD